MKTGQLLKQDHSPKHTSKTHNRFLLEEKTEVFVLCSVHPTDPTFTENLWSNL